MQRPPQHLADLSSEVSARLESCVSRFEAAWQAGRRPAVDDYLISDGSPRRPQLLELIYTDLEYRLKAGEPARVEDYLRRYPELAEDRDMVLDLLAVELELRRRSLPLTGVSLGPHTRKKSKGGWAAMFSWRKSAAARSARSTRRWIASCGGQWPSRCRIAAA